MKKYLIESFDEIERLKFQNTIGMYDMDQEIHFIDFLKDQKVLDAGCGTGNLIQKIISQHDVKIDGLELSHERVLYTKDRFKDFPNVSIFQGSLEDTKFDNDTYDKVVLRYVFEHVTKPKEILKEMNRIIKVDGKIFIINFDDIFFNFYTKNEFVNYCLKKLKTSIPQDFEIGRKLPRFLVDSGFVNVKWSAQTFFLKGEALELEKKNNEMRLFQARDNLAQILGGFHEYDRFLNQYLEEMDDSSNVMSFSKFLVKADKLPYKNGGI